MNFVFRVDSSYKIGSGHLMRCLVLANSLSKAGHQISFICRNHEGDISKSLIKSKFKLNLLDNNNLEPSYDNTNSWLGVSQEQDALQTINYLKDSVCDWLIVDHYCIDKLWQKRLRKYTNKILVIDDLANRAHDCDILVDSNYVKGYKTRYQDILNKSCLELLGPNYCFIAEEFKNHKLRSPKRTGEVKKVLIYFGGVDQFNLTRKCIEAFSTNKLENIKLEVVVGAMNKDYENLKSIASKKKSIILHRSLPTLSKLMSSVDLSIGAGGVTTWERLFLGLPSIIIAIADNQIAGAEELSKNKFVSYLGFHSELSAKNLRDSICKKIEKPNDLLNESHVGQILVDGNGISRILGNL